MDKRLFPLSKNYFEETIVPIIERARKKSGRPSKTGLYEFFCGALYILRTGSPWRDLPKCFGSWHTVYTRFKRWSENGFFWRLLYTLQSLKKVTLEVVFVDGSLVPLHRHGSGAKKK